MGHFFAEFKIDPVPKGRPRASSRGGFVRMYTDAKTRTFEAQLRAMVKSAFKAEPFTGALAVTLVFKLRKPSSVKRLTPCVRPDLDNFIKCLDALNGIVFVDDGQIIKLTAEKVYDVTPSVSIAVKEI